MQEKRIFRLQGVKKTTTQTLLGNARLNRVQIQRFGVDATGREAFIKLRDSPSYVPVGEVPAAHQAFMKSLHGENFEVKAKVLGGGWSVQTSDGLEVARYGDYDQIAPHHISAMLAGDYVSVRLNHGLEITVLTGVPDLLCSTK